MSEKPISKVIHRTYTHYITVCLVPEPKDTGSEADIKQIDKNLADLGVGKLLRIQINSIQFNECL